MDDDVISEKLDSISREMRSGFIGNAEEHRRIFQTLEAIKVAAAAERNHTHEHCEDCVRHNAEITTIKEQMSLRDKIGIGAILALVGTAIKTWLMK